MKQKELDLLIKKYFASTATAKEKKKLLDHYNENLNRDIEWLSDDQRAEENLKLAILGNIRSEAGLRSSGGVFKLWKKVAVAASVVLALGTGFYFYQNKQHDVQQIAYDNDVAPGKNGATLTLSDGRVISIDSAGSGQLAMESGVRIVKGADGELVYEIIGGGDATKMNVLSTSNGQIARLRLPDSSLVYLNAASSLTYPSSFSGLDYRKVQLTGEAYFEVAKDRAHPFKVITASQEVEVLGTHFNINSYSDEPVVKTTLLEGSVRVAGKSGGTAILKPGQQVALSGGGLKVSEADVELAVAWKNNEFAFESEPLENVMRMVERWYNVEVIYEGDVTDEKFGGSVSRFDNVSKVLKSLESTNLVHFRIEGRKIYVSK